MNKIGIEHAQPLHEQVYERLWAQLIQGELKAGQRLKDTECAAALNVSRTPVREALRKLAHDGALDSQGIGGYRVHVFATSEIGDVYRCRASLEALVVEEVTGTYDAELGAALTTNLAEAEAALASNDYELLQRLNGDFHASIFHKCTNAHLLRLLDQTQRIVQMARRQVLALSAESASPAQSYRRSLVSVLEDHRSIHLAMSHGKAQRAAALMRGHLLTTAQDMMSVIQCCDGAASAA